MNLRMDFKWLIVLLLVGLSLYVVYLAFFKPLSLNDLLQRKEVSYANILKQINSSKSICIVFDYSDLEDPIRQNVGQCAADIAYSYTSWFKRPVYVFGIENGICTTLNKTKSESECIREILSKDCFVFLIKGDENVSTKSFNNLMEINVGKSYKAFDCSIRINGKVSPS